MTHPSSGEHAKHGCGKGGVERKESIGYKYRIFRMVKGHKGVTLHALMSLRASGRRQAAAAAILTLLLPLGSP